MIGLRLRKIVGYWLLLVKGITHSAVAYDGVKKQPVYSSVSQTRKEEFTFFASLSRRLLFDYELAPSLSFHPKSSEKDIFYSLARLEGDLGVADSDPRSADVNEQFGNFMQGAADDCSITNLSPAQMGV